MLSAIILTAAVVLSPNPNAIGPVARPLCMMNVGPSTIVFAGDVKDVRLSEDKTAVWLLSTGGKLDTVAVPAGADAVQLRNNIALSVRETWNQCLRAQ